MAAGEDRNSMQTPSPFAHDPVGDEEELQQYGVWVKAGPEDVDESEAEDEAFAMSDILDDVELDISLEDDESPEDLFEEEPIAGNEDSDTPETDLELDIDDAPAVKEEPERETDIDALSLDDEIELDIPDNTEDLLTLDDTDLTVDLTEQPEEDTEPEPVISDEDVVEEPRSHKSDESGIMDEDLNIEEELPDDLGDLTLDLNDLDVDGFAEPEHDGGEIEEPEEPEPVEELDYDELGDEETDAEGAKASFDGGEFEDDLSLTTLSEDTGFDEITEEELGQSPEEDLPELQIEDEEESIEFDLSEVGEEPDFDLDRGFDDVSAVEAEMSAPEPVDMTEERELVAETTEPFEDDQEEAEEAPAPQGTAAADTSVALLQDIESELHTIRAELAGLRSELSRLRNVESPPSVPDTEAPESAVDGEAAGFFEEDEDETIALTGSELDNIMNTAEFTEEAGKPTELDEQDIVVAGFEPSAEPLDADDLVPDEIIPMDDDASPTVETISLEEPEEEPEPLDLDIAEYSEPSSAADDHVKALAEMDIDAELSDIEDLADLDDDEPGTRQALDELASGSETDFSVEPQLPDEAPASDEVQEPAAIASEADTEYLPDAMKTELKSVLSYMDQLLESLPEEKIQEFAESEHFEVYKRLFEELGLEQ